MEGSEILQYVAQYGYLAIFGFVFLQEIGVPTPVPNEVMLLFAGYLAAIGTLNYWLVAGAAVAADIIGTSILYFAFYFFGRWFLAHRPHWFPVNQGNIEKIKQRLIKRGRWGIFIGRILPYIRGYTSVATALIQMPYKIFLPMVTLSALLWSGGYVTAGKILGDRVGDIFPKLGNIKAVIFIAIGTIGLYFAIRYLYKRFQKKQKLL